VHSRGSFSLEAKEKYHVGAKENIDQQLDKPKSGAAGQDRQHKSHQDGT
jgi:hypothetical protein